MEALKTLTTTTWQGQVQGRVEKGHRQRQNRTHIRSSGSNLIAAGNLCCRLRPSDLQSDVRRGTGDEAATGAETGAGALSLSCCTPVASILHATGYWRCGGCFCFWCCSYWAFMMIIIMLMMTIMMMGSLAIWAYENFMAWPKVKVAVQCQVIREPRWAEGKLMQYEKHN